jgi:peptide/nickel transport system permease protein
VLLEQAQNYQVIVLTPWLLLPGLFVVLTVMAFNLFGDGLRDAADPYNTGGE